MREFLRKEIEQGWGNKADVKEEVLNLGRRLLIAGTGKAEYPQRMGIGEWWERPEVHYAKLTDELLYLGGIRFELIRSSGQSEHIPFYFDAERRIMMVSPCHVDEDLDKLAVYQTKLNINDVLLMASDGLDNICRRKNLSREDVSAELTQIVASVQQNSPSQIRDTLLNKIGSDLIPCLFEEFVKYPAEMYDDVTMVVIKRSD